MKISTRISLLVLFLSTCMIAQVPQPRSTAGQSGSPLSWTKKGKYDFQLYNENGKAVSTIKDLYYLGTDTLAVLDNSKRSVYLLNDFKDASDGARGSVTLLAENVKSNFYLTNPYSFAHFVNDEYNTGTYANINGSYVYYLAEKDRTYYLRDIRKYPNWGARSSELLDYSANNTYWYRDVFEGTYGIVKQGKSIDYDRVTSERDGNDLVVTWDSVKTYVLEGYYTSASYVFKPVKMYTSASTSVNTASGSSGCVRGDCQNGWGKYEYGEDGHYDGFWRNGKRHGYGLYKWKDGSKYIGNWRDDTMYDYGVYLAENGDNIIGFYKDGQLNGLGLTVINDEYEQGVYSNGNLVTKHTFYTNKVDTGCTAGDCQNKYGRFKYDNGDVYTGFFKNGNLHMGTYTFADGGKYTGMFNSNNQFHGMGRYFFTDNAYYGGQWVNGKYHGLGYYHDKDLNQQIGEWSNGSLVRQMN
ncbi:MAG: hypothetical protein AAF466_12005 [Bacteroidota bacterium]